MRPLSKHRLERFIYTIYRSRLEGGSRRIAFATLIKVFCLIIEHALSQDAASHFFLMKLWQKSRLAYAAIFVCKFRNKTNSLRADKVLLLRNLLRYDLTQQMP